MEPEKQIEIRSNDVQEIISQVPHGLVRWGITVIFLVMLALLAASWFIKYPDILVAEVVITSDPAPVTLVSRVPGRITLLKRDKEKCEAGELIGYIQSNANVADVLELESWLAQDSLPARKYELGDLQPVYSALTQAITNLTIFQTADTYGKQIEQLERQLATFQKLAKSLAGQQRLGRQELALARQKFNTDSVLFTQKVTAALDYNQAKTNWLQQQRQYRNLETTVLNNELQIHQLEKQIADLEMSKAEQQQKLMLTKENARQELESRIKLWKENHLLTAQAKGQLAYLGFYEPNMFTEANKAMFSVLPDSGRITARALLPITGSGKVKTGQRVNIKLESFPFQQFGMLEGQVATISALPADKKYLVLLNLPDPLITNQKVNIEFKQELEGTTEIVTEDLRLLHRFLFHLKSLLERKKQNPASDDQQVGGREGNTG